MHNRHIKKDISIIMVLLKANINHIIQMVILKKKQIILKAPTVYKIYYENGNLWIEINYIYGKKMV